MTNPEIQVFADLDQLSRAAAERFCQLTQETVAAGKTFCAALSGGATPRELYQLLASADFSRRISWQKVQLFQVDERCVPPDHPESNYRMMREALLDRVPIPTANFRRMVAESPDLEEAARRYGEELRQVLRPAAGEWPRLDLIFLGMGPDGHTASLFPGSAALEEQKLWVRPNNVEKLRMYRLTLTFPVINAAQEIIFLVAGEEKAEALRGVLKPTSQPERYPAQRIRPTNGRLRWYVDKAAARLL